MRYSPFYLLACAALSTACQPITPASIKAASPNPKLVINEAALLPATNPATPVSSETLSPESVDQNNEQTEVTLLSTTNPATPVPSETLSSGSIDQNNEQTEIDLAISTISQNNNTQANTQKESPNISPQVFSSQKIFDLKKIIGDATTALIRDLGKANMIRQEGQIEVWQYQFTSCVIDFFFYPVGKDASQLIAKSWDMRSLIMSERLERDKCHNEMNLYHRKILSKL